MPLARASRRSSSMNHEQLLQRFIDQELSRKSGSSLSSRSDGTRRCANASSSSNVCARRVEAPATVGSGRFCRKRSQILLRARRSDDEGGARASCRHEPQLVDRAPLGAPGPALNLPGDSVRLPDPARPRRRRRSGASGACRCRAGVLERTSRAAGGAGAARRRAAGCESRSGGG